MSPAPEQETPRRLCVFSGSSTGISAAYECAARRLGEQLARSGIDLVYGGAAVGLMGAVADAVLASGGRVIGVIPQALVEKEVAHRGLTELRIVSSMHERKALMADLADAFVALPGGYGTLDEFCEVLTWAQLSLHGKPCGLLNVAGYYDPLLAQVARATQDGLTRPEHQALILVEMEPGRLLQRFREYQAVALPKWVNPDLR